MVAGREGGPTGKVNNAEHKKNGLWVNLAFSEMHEPPFLVYSVP